MRKRKDYFKLFFVRDFAYSIIVPGPLFHLFKKRAKSSVL